MLETSGSLGSLYKSQKEKLIVYYAPREEKTWTVHSSCKLPLQTRAVGWPILFPWCVYYFSPYPGRKYHIPVSEQRGNVALSARVWRKCYLQKIKFSLICMFLIL